MQRNQSEKSLRPLPHSASNHSFGCGQANRTGLRLRFFVDEEGSVVSRFKAPRRFEGPPGYMHGGAIATLMDEAMSKACRARNVVAMTRQMEVEYLRPVPLGEPLVLEGTHVRHDRRKHSCEASVKLSDGTVLARARGIFIAIDVEKMFPAHAPGATSSSAARSS